MERVLNLPETPRRAPRGANALVLPVDHDRARGCASSDVLRHRQALFGHARSDKGIADRVATHDVPLLRDVLRGTRAGDMRGRVAQRLVPAALQRAAEQRNGCFKGRRGQTCG